MKSITVEIKNPAKPYKPGRQFKRALSFLVVFCFVCVYLKAQIDCIPVFVKAYADVTRDIEPYAVKTLPEGGYIVAGRERVAAKHFDAIAMKLSDKGDIVWSVVFEGSDKSNLTGVVTLKNGDFLVYGSTSSFGYIDEKAWVVRMSGSGLVIWSKQIGVDSKGVDRIKAMLELPDGSLVGTFNTDDSSAKSDPVVFKTTADGSLKWAHIFDNGDEDAFSSLAFNSDTIYAAGSYTASLKHGVIVKLKSADGAVISSQTVYDSHTSYNEEVMGFQVYDNIISYGLHMDAGTELEGMILKQTDIAGKDLYSRYLNNSYDTKIQQIQRTKNNGFYVLRIGKASFSPTITRFNRFGLDEWTKQLQEYYLTQSNYSMDTTADGGCVSIGFYDYFTYPSGPRHRAHLVKTNDAGFSGSCSPQLGGGIYSDTGSCRSVGFTWQKETDFSPAIFEAITPSIQSYKPAVDTLCDTTLCIDKTPLPEGCFKTYRNEYASNKFTSFKDMLATTDGGKIITGNIQFDALLVKLKQNGDVEWAKSYEEFADNMSFLRVLRTNDNNLFVFANNGYTIDHGVSTLVNVLKLTNDGDVIWVKDINTTWFPQLSDVIATPDDGFIMIMNGGYGMGDTHSYVVRFDANGNVVWKKELTHFASTPVYRSVTIDHNAVYLAFDTYDNYNQDKFGVDKLDYATGNQLWSNRYTVGTDNVERVNRIYSINDTAYVFLNNFEPLSPFWNIHSLLLTKLDPSGNIIGSFSLVPGTMLPFSQYFTEIETASTVTMSPSFDFVLTNRIVSGSDTSLNISRFLKNGKTVWSHNFPGMKNYTPLNIHPQGDGFLIAGFVTPNSPYFPNSFLLKVDSSGVIIPSATGDCSYTDNNLKKEAFSSVAISYPAIDSVIDLNPLDIKKGSVLIQDVFVDATPYCNTSGSCGNVGFKQKGNGCSLTDTLEYYLENAASCNAAATWNYDPAFFTAVAVNGQVIDLVPLKNGVSTVTANIEGNCSYTEKKLTASVLLSASQLNLGNDTIICNNGSIRLSAGPGYKSYKWQDNSIDSIFTATAAGTYFVTVTDNCGGSSTDTIAIKDPGAFFEVTNDTTKCNNDSMVLQASAGYNNYKWSPQYYLNANGNSAVVNPGETTRYFVQAEKEPGCVVRDSVLVSVVSTPGIFLGNDTSLCTNQSIVLDAGSGFGSYNWNTGLKTETINVSSKGSYYVTGYKDGCFSSDTLKVLNVSPPPAFTLGNDTTLCPDANIEYNFNFNSATYIWSDGSSSNPKSINHPGTWSLSITQSGCISSDTVSIAAKPGPIVFLGNDTAVCNASTLILTAYNDRATYHWQDGSNSPTFSVTSSGKYYVSVTKDECISTDTISVQYKQIPYFTLGKDSFLCNGTVIKLEPSISNPVLSYLWQDGSSKPYYVVSSAGLFWLKATIECGYYSDSITITNGTICELQVPSAFTPNNDGLNDEFRVKFPYQPKQFTLTIFNRWGQKVFESRDIYKGWNGIYKGHPLDRDTFIWVISLTDSDNRKNTIRGTVTLIK